MVLQLKLEEEYNDDFLHPNDYHDDISTRSGGSCSNRNDQSDYRGTINVTRHGFTCQRWDSQLPHEHKYTPENYPNDGLVGNNYCRNPGKSYELAWCYITYPHSRRDLCNVPRCTDDTSTGTIWFGIGFFGALVAAVLVFVFLVVMMKRRGQQRRSQQMRRQQRRIQQRRIQQRRSYQRSRQSRGQRKKANEEEDVANELSLAINV